MQHVKYIEDYLLDSILFKAKNTNNTNKIKMTIIDEYLFYQEKYAKKFGKNKTVVLMQVGSFHEAYATDERGPDLKELSDVLNLICTKKDKKKKEVSTKNPYMLGFPSVAFEKYIKILVNNGYTIPIIDQVTPPPEPKRELTQIISPGTYISENLAPEHNNVMSLFIEDEVQKDGSVLICIGMSVIDLSTGTSTIYEVISKHDDDMLASDEAVRFIHSCNPKEITIIRKKTDHPNVLNKSKLISYLELDEKHYIYTEKINKAWFKISYQNSFFLKIFNDIGLYSSALEYLDLETVPYATMSLLNLYEFAYQHNEKILNNLPKPSHFKYNTKMILGNNAIFQLNVLSNNDVEFSKSKYKSLFNVVNNNVTSIGKRFLKDTLVAPLLDVDELNKRYSSIDFLLKNNKYESLRDIMKNIHDIERLHRKIAIKMIHPHEFYEFVQSYKYVQKIIDNLKKSKTLQHILPDNKICAQVKDFIKLIEKQYIDDELSKYKINEIENSFFKKGINKEIDKIQQEIDICIALMNNVCGVLSTYVDDVGKAKYIKKKKDITVEIANDEEYKIKLDRNNKEGYFLSLTKLRAKSLKKNIKDKTVIEITDKYNIQTKNLIFKELDKGNTKIFFDELNKRSDTLIEMREKMRCICKEKYVELLGEYQKDYGFMFRKMSELIGKVDFLASAAKTAHLYGYNKPEIILDKDKGFVKCTKLRHPIIERINQDTEYIPHDIYLGQDPTDDTDNINGMLVFGINSCGKSSLMKAIGLSVIMAQAGMFVPAENYSFSPYESLFARITGNDNIFKGLSSFALEMTELKAILRRAGPKIMVIGDEVCRGTEHISGNAIVASTLIELSEVGATFIFATHLHEIPHIPDIKNLNNVKSFHLTVEYNSDTDSLIFDRILKEGPGDSIYGITIAKYIIDNNKFIKRAISIRNQLIEKPSLFMSDKTSRYNSNVYMDHCGACNFKFTTKNKCIGYLDTHHINNQKDCSNGFVNNKPYFKMNSEANLVPLCKKCHTDNHNDKILITGYKKTSRGVKLQIKKTNQ